MILHTHCPTVRFKPLSDKDCRRRWWLTYYRRLKPREQKFVGPLALGSRIHEALDQYYTSGTDLLEVHSKLVAQDRELIIEAGRFPEELDGEADLGRIMLEGYLQWVEEEGIDNELEMISTEEILNMPMFDGAVELQGKIDMRVRRKGDGVRMFRDFKTVGGSFEQFASTAHMNEQILTYMLLEQHKNGEGERSEGGIFTLLKKVKRTANAKPPFYDQFEVRHNIFSLRSFWQRLHGVVADMMRVKTALDEGTAHQAVAYPSVSKDCTWKCPFFSVCPMFDDGSAVEYAIEEMFVASDPYAYYGVTEKKGSE